MTLLSNYHAALTEFSYQEDPLQLAAVQCFQDLADGLIERQREGQIGNKYNLRNVFDNLFDKVFDKEREPVKGIYLWGEVARGKTFLMDLFYEYLPYDRKRRQHFHRFMHDTHAKLNELKNEVDPLKIIADEIARTTDIICFDEFFVSDIADAMILGTLFTELFYRGVSLVATSNCEPDKLYKGGLQRARFIPAIEQIKLHCDVMKLDGDTDYRLRVLEQAEIYHSPLDDSSDENLKDYFVRIAPNTPIENQDLIVHGRAIQSRLKAEGVIWFDFHAICETERSQVDYIEISREFHTVIVSNVPTLDEYKENAARRFIALVDEFYDRQVKLILSAELPLFELYQGKRLSFEFQRTESRLQEMQSLEYLAKPHLA